MHWLSEAWYDHIKSKRELAMSVPPVLKAQEYVIYPAELSEVTLS